MIGEMDFGATFIDTIGEDNQKTYNPENAFPKVAFFFFVVCLVLLTIALVYLLVSILLSHLREKIFRAALMFCFSPSSSEIAPVAHLHRAVTREVVSSKLRPDQHSGSLKITEEKSAAFVISSANG